MHIDQIEDSGGNSVAIICDNNRVKRPFFKRFPCISPWRTENNVFLIFDFIHIVRSIRNNWITDKASKLEFSYRGDYVAIWAKSESFKNWRMETWSRRQNLVVANKCGS